MAHIRRLLTPEQKQRQRAGDLPADEKPKGLWQATVRHPSGQRWSTSDPLKKVVTTWADDQEAAMRRGEFVDPNAGKMTLDDWWVKWSATRRIAKATEKKNDTMWRNHIKPAFGTWPLVAIQSWDVEKWVTDMEKRSVGATTVVVSLRLLSQSLRAAVKHKLIRVNTAADVTATQPAEHVDRYLTREEGDQLLAAFESDDRDFVEMLLNTGMRWQEAAGLKAIRVEMLRKRVKVQTVFDRWGNEKVPKGSSKGQRDIALTDSLLARLSRRITAPDESLVFTSPEGKRLRYDNWLRRVWYPALKRAKLADPQPTPHDCRHTYGTWLADSGMPVNQIAALMGISLKTAENYIHAAEARMDAAREALSERQQSGRVSDQRGTGEDTSGQIPGSESG